MKHRYALRRVNRIVPADLHEEQPLTMAVSFEEAVENFRRNIATINAGLRFNLILNDKPPLHDRDCN